MNPVVFMSENGIYTLNFSSAQEHSKDKADCLQAGSTDRCIASLSVFTSGGLLLQVSLLKLRLFHLPGHAYNQAP